MFQPLFTDKLREPDYLTYVEPLQPVSLRNQSKPSEVTHTRNESSGLYKVSRVLDEDRSRRGIVINLTDIWRAVDVVPAFGRSCPDNWNTENTVELAREFYINSFYEKSIYKDLR